MELKWYKFKIKDLSFKLRLLVQCQSTQCQVFGDMAFVGYIVVCTSSSVYIIMYTDELVQKQTKLNILHQVYQGLEFRKDLCPLVTQWLSSVAKSNVILLYDMCVQPSVPSNCHASLQSMYRRHEQERGASMISECVRLNMHASFTPLFVYNSCPLHTQQRIRGGTGGTCTPLCTLLHIVLYSCAPPPSLRNYIHTLVHPHSPFLINSCSAPVLQVEWDVLQQCSTRDLCTSMLAEKRDISYAVTMNWL